MLTWLYYLSPFKRRKENLYQARVVTQAYNLTIRKLRHEDNLNSSTVFFTCFSPLAHLLCLQEPNCIHTHTHTEFSLKCVNINVIKY